MNWPTKIKSIFFLALLEGISTKNHCENVGEFLCVDFEKIMLELFPFKEAEFPYKEVNQKFEPVFP